MDMNKAKMINDAVVSTVERKAEERGREEGREEGLEKGKIEVALNLLEEGLPVDLIAKTTGLSVEQVKQLRNK